MLRILIMGATGRMGQAIVRAAHARQDEFRVVGAIASEASAHRGEDVGELAGVGPLGIRIESNPATALPEADVAIDFSQPGAAAANLAACVAAGKPLLIGTTGLPADIVGDLERASQHIPLLAAPNTSLGITLLTELVRKAARTLSLDFDIEIVEAHHRAKKDAPSGTALALGQAAAEERNQRLEDVAVTGNRHSETGRRRGDIGFAVVRGGDIVGNHAVIFAGAGEQLILEHRATDRAIFARGALDAARWLVKQPAGRYSMRDIIGDKSEA